MEKAVQLLHHSEKLAFSYGLIRQGPASTIRIVKNLRSYEEFMKLISKIYQRDITNAFPSFKKCRCQRMCKSCMTIISVFKWERRYAVENAQCTVTRAASFDTLYDHWQIPKPKHGHDQRIVSNINKREMLLSIGSWCWITSTLDGMYYWFIIHDKCAQYIWVV